MSAFLVRPANRSDSTAWAAMRADLWPEDSAAGHAFEIVRLLEHPSPRIANIVAESHESQLVGFVEMSIRNYAEGCETENVGYCEGWYVLPAYRRSGVGRALIAAGIEWARAQGCTEFASDALLDNEVSHAAHRALGFEEVCRTVAFKLREKK